MSVCSLEGCLNRLTSHSPCNPQLPLFTVKNLCLSCSVIPYLTYLVFRLHERLKAALWLPSTQDIHKVDLTWRVVTHTIYSWTKNPLTHIVNSYKHSQSSRRKLQENCSNTLSFPRVMLSRSCWSLHMCTHMSACCTIPIRFSSLLSTYCAESKELFSVQFSVWIVRTNLSFIPSLITPSLKCSQNQNRKTLSYRDGLYKDTKVTASFG